MATVIHQHGRLLALPRQRRAHPARGATELTGCGSTKHGTETHYHRRSSRRLPLHTLDTGAKWLARCPFRRVVPSLPLIYRRVAARILSFIPRQACRRDDVQYRRIVSHGRQEYRKEDPHQILMTPHPLSESLGDQTMAEFTRTGRHVSLPSIPAGTIGTISQSALCRKIGTSPELKTTVMTKHSDPWAGQLTTQSPT